MDSPKNATSVTVNATSAPHHILQVNRLGSLLGLVVWTQGDILQLRSSDGL